MVIESVRKLIDLFMPHCKDVKSMSALRTMTTARDSWRDAHALFRSIREKTLRAERGGDKTAECQYLFEEACAQTLYNLSGEPAPFDADTPFWIVPNALALARRLGIEASQIVEVISSSR